MDDVLSCLVRATLCYPVARSSNVKETSPKRESPTKGKAYKTEAPQEKATKKGLQTEREGSLEALSNICIMHSHGTFHRLMPHSMLRRKTLGLLSFLIIFFVRECGEEVGSASRRTQAKMMAASVTTGLKRGTGVLASNLMKCRTVPSHRLAIEVVRRLPSKFATCRARREKRLPTPPTFRFHWTCTPPTSRQARIARS